MGPRPLHAPHNGISSDIAKSLPAASNDLSPSAHLVGKPKATKVTTQDDSDSHASLLQDVVAQARVLANNRDCGCMKVRQFVGLIADKLGIPRRQLHEAFSQPTLLGIAREAILASPYAL